jgi:outer membrane lipoprotein SlyB
MTTMSSEPDAGATTPRPWLNRNHVLLAAGVTLAGLGLAAGLAFSPPHMETTPASAEATRASLASNESLVERNPAPAAIAAPPAALPVPVQPAALPRTPDKAIAGERLAQAVPPAARVPAPCRHCGVVESVRAVKKKGEGTGVGAVAGGVVGGVVGNQFGHGNGRAAMTVLGAVGGGLAGHEIEKRSRSVTVYDVQVRMDDGSLRKFEQATAPAVGARVTVDGNKLRLAAARQRAPASHVSSRV